MEIKTKYDINDTVELKLRNSITVGVITRIDIFSMDKGCYSIEYLIKVNREEPKYYAEHELLGKIN